jgi:hypothetical protein
MDKKLYLTKENEQKKLDLIISKKVDPTVIICLYLFQDENIIKKLIDYVDLRTIVRQQLLSNKMIDYILDIDPASLSVEEQYVDLEWINNSQLLLKQQINKK